MIKLPVTMMNAPAISAAMVTDVEAGFHEEHLELQLAEVEQMRARAAAFGGAEEGEEGGLIETD